MRVILASTSPRRIELLTNAGLQFEIQAPLTDEIENPRETPTAMVKRLAVEKAMAVVKRTENLANSVVISADTTVVTPSGKAILSKPKNRQDAIRMIGTLSGAFHTVLTAYCLWITDRSGKRHKKIVRVVKTRVKIKRLSKNQCAEYVDCGESMDKAGAYAAQGRGMTLIEEIRGSYTNVVGLPMAQLLADLGAWTSRKT